MILLKILKKVIFIFTNSKSYILVWERTFGLFLLAEEVFIFFLKLLQMYEVFIFLDTHNALTSERGISLALELVFPGELAFPGERRNFLFLPGENRIALLLPGRERTHLLLLPGESRITLFLTGEESTKILILAWERWVSWKSKKTSIEKKNYGMESVPGSPLWILEKLLFICKVKLFQEAKFFILIFTCL